MATQTEKFVPISVAANRLMVTTESVRRYCREGLRHRRTPGGHYQVSSEAIDEFLRMSTSGGVPEIKGRRDDA